MKRAFLLLLSLTFAVTALGQGGSPLKMVNFHKLPNEIVDLKALKDEVGRDTDLDGNKAALVRVKAQGFSEKTMLDFSCYTRGVEMIVQKHKNGEWWWYLGSNCQGSIIIKYMGEYEFKLPNKLDAKGVYELVLGMETATLVINVVPQTADIYVDGNKIGTGYGSAAISVGSEHRYKVTCADYIPEEDVVKSDKAEKIEKQIELRPNFGYITIKSEPSGAEVYIDDIKVGTTPYMMKKIKLGRHTVEVGKYGYESQADMVIIKVDEVNKQFENVKLVEDKSVPQQTEVVQQQQVVPQQQVVLQQQSVPQQQAPTASMTKNSNLSKSAKLSGGVFSVASNRKVNFSKGNLQYQASTNTWRFADHQWDIIGDDNKNISSSYSGWIDLFGWGTGNNPTKSSTSSSDYSNFRDWGNNSISNGGGRNWFTLTKDEWVYVFNTRSTSSGIRYAKATVNGVNGVILLPDNWSSSNYSLSNTNKYDAGFSSNRISQSDWTNKFEANGAVFLPAAGWRDGTNVDYVGSYGTYWSASYKGSDYAYYVGFSDGSLLDGFWDYRRHGHSVRPVCSAEN